MVKYTASLASSFLHTHTIIYFQIFLHIPDTLSIVIRVCYDDHFVSQTDQMLRQTPDMHLDTTHARIKEIANHCYPVCPSPLSHNIVRFHYEC